MEMKNIGKICNSWEFMNPTLWLNFLRRFDYKNWLNESIDKMETKINGYNTRWNHSNLSLWIITENNSLIFFPLNYWDLSS
jgi:hypothetical protein